MSPRRRSRRSSPPPAPSMFGFDSWPELAKPRDLAKIFETQEYTKWRSFRDSEDCALRQPGAAAHARAPAVRRGHQGDRRVQLRGGAVRRGRRGEVDAARRVLLDERGLRDGRAADRRLRAVWLLHRDPRRGRRRQGGEPAVPRVHLGRRRPGREVPDRDRHHRPARVRAVQSRLPAALPLQEHRLLGVLRRAVGAEAEEVRPARRRPPTRRSRRACPTSWRPAASRTT